MTIIEDKYTIKKDIPNCQNKSFISFSDIHFGIMFQLFYTKSFELFLKHIYENANKKLDAILIPGDLLFWLFRYQNKEYIRNLNQVLNSLSYNLSTPIFISYGNHDLPFKTNLNAHEKEYWDLRNYIENRSNGIYVLDNEQYRLQDMVITGFSPNRDAYNPNNMPNKALNEAYECFIDKNFIFNGNEINILMSHENKFFTHPKVLKNYASLYEKLTLIIGGHLHDGYVPLFIQKAFLESLKDNGIWEKFPPNINMCRGAFKVSKDSVSSVYLPKESFLDLDLNPNETASIINRGVAKYSWFINGAMAVTHINVETEKKRELSKNI